MNSSDDSTDKALKERFQRVFNDFERSPSRSLKKRIWKQLPAASSGRSRYVVLAVFVLLLISGALYGPKRMASQVQPKRLTPDQPRRFAHRLNNTDSPQSQPQATIHTDQTISDKDSNGQAISPPAGSSTRSTVQPVLRSGNPAIDMKAARPRQYARPTARFARSRTVQDQVRLFPVISQAGRPVDHGPIVRTEKPANPDQAIPTPVYAVSEIVGADSVFGQDALARLQPVAIRPLRVPDYTIRRQVVKLPQQPTEATAESHRAPLRWLASVSPLSTFQFMTIVARPESYVQRVDAPATFSAPTWSYQVSGGVMWRQFAVQLMAGQLRRWAYYDLATNEYQIEATGQNEYRITRLGQSVAENSSLTLLGASLDKEYTLGLGKRPGQYAARVGGQGTYLPATGQTLLWGQAALTTAIPLRSAYSIQVGPTVQYGFSRLFSGDRQLNIHPFLVGASFTIRPTTH
ncbi:hypothetical protein [Fibrella aquatica]|uniref:hypothetical protein n=1 Tax=Fibrella aquatica TaxID=3242487 RepID=UPI00351FB16B